MMKRRKWILVEVLVAGLILLILGTVVLPQFLQSQRSGAPYRFIRTLQMLLDAIEQYQVDFGGIPDHALSFQISQNTVNQKTYDFLYSSYKLENIKEPYEFFYQTGYVNRIPDFAEMEEHLVSSIRDVPLHPNSTFRNTIDIFGHANKLPNQLYQVDSFFIFVRWPQSSKQSVGYFFKELEKYELASTELYEDLGVYMDPYFYFAPSNGLDSAGYIYVDSEGNHSPWD